LFEFLWLDVGARVAGFRFGSPGSGQVAGTGPYYQLGNELYLLVLVPSVGHFVEEKLGGNPAKPCRGWRTEVSGTAAAPANSMSSYPTMARSSGTRMPRAAGQQIRQLAVYPVQQAGAQQQILDVAVAGGKHGFRSDRADKADKGE
jgi:hypothetical protein